MTSGMDHTWKGVPTGSKQYLEWHSFRITLQAKGSFEITGRVKKPFLERPWTFLGNNGFAWKLCFFLHLAAAICAARDLLKSVLPVPMVLNGALVRANWCFYGKQAFRPDEITFFRRPEPNFGTWALSSEFGCIFLHFVFQDETT